MKSLLAAALLLASSAVAGAQSIAQLRDAAERGDMAAAHRLGVAYRDGIGVLQDYVEADVWMGLAALLERGPRAAEYNEAVSELEKRLTPVQSTEATTRGVVVLRRLAAAGDSRALVYLAGFLYQGLPQAGLPQDQKQAVDFMRQAAAKGEPQAMFLLGRAYADGGGVLQDHAQAADWYRKAGDLGNADAHVMLGAMFASGTGVARDSVQAVRLFRLAAEKNHALAQHNLGVMLSEGRGVAADLVEAHMWANLAASHASADQQMMFADSRDRIAKAMTPDQIAEAQRRARDWMDRHATSAGMPPPPPPPGTIRVGGDIPEPAKLKDVRPEYPAIAQSARVQGIVILEATIGPDGKIVDANVLQSIPLLDQAAIDAVKQWEYTPTVVNGVPVPVIMTVTVKFTLQ
jgi:TonB family protein